MAEELHHVPWVLRLVVERRRLPCPEDLQHNFVEASVLELDEELVFLSLELSLNASRPLAAPKRP